MSPDPSATDLPPEFNCPKCGQPLNPHAYRTEIDGDGHPERVYVYLCLKDGFFTFTHRQGLIDGL